MTLTPAQTLRTLLNTASNMDVRDCALRLLKAYDEGTIEAEIDYQASCLRSGRLPGGSARAIILQQLLSMPVVAENLRDMMAFTIHTFPRTTDIILKFFPGQGIEAANLRVLLEVAGFKYYQSHKSEGRIGWRVARDDKNCTPDIYVDRVIRAAAGV